MYLILLRLLGVYYSKHHNKTDKPTLNKEPHPQPLNQDNQLGVVTGISISSFFLLIFIVICFAKDPCRKIRSNDGILNERNYCQQRLLTDNTSSNRLLDSTESSELGNNQNKSES